MKQFFLILGGLVSFSTSATDWVQISAGMDRSRMFVDFDYYKYNSKNKTTDLWYKIDLNDDDRYYIAVKSLTRYDCNNKTSAELMKVVYSPDGKVVKVLKESELGKTDYIIPGTYSDIVWGIACDTFGKGLDFKYSDNIEFYATINSKRAKYAYARQKMTKDPNEDIDPSLNDDNFETYSEFRKAEMKILGKMRDEFLKGKM